MWRRQLDSISGVCEGMRCNNRSSIASGSLVAELAVETFSSSHFANPGRYVTTANQVASCVVPAVSATRFGGSAAVYNTPGTIV